MLPVFLSYYFSFPPSGKRQQCVMAHWPPPPADHLLPAFAIAAPAVVPSIPVFCLRSQRCGEDGRAGVVGEE